jgi:hypothetical protein
MANQALQYEIHDVPDPEGGLVIDLVAEGARLARAAASADILGDMQTMLGMDRASVAAELRAALLEYLKNQLATVTVSDPVEDPARKLRFKSRFTLRSGHQIHTGVVWYDVTESTTGPESLPAVVRNKMRHEVHRKLTDPGSAARALVDLHK